jgi:FlaA1/EpsC-like NDP-sugar epimerase
VLDFFFFTTFTTSFRFGPRIAIAWWTNLRRAQRSDSKRTLIVGAGPAGDLLSRDLLRGENQHYLVGFVDDAEPKVGTYLNGRPVLGMIDDLPRIVEQRRISHVLIATPGMAPQRIRKMLDSVSQQKVSFKIVPASFEYLDRRISAAMLHDLSPADLLPRESIRFDEDEVRGLIAGKRIMVTGGAGSIGSETARQVAQRGASHVVLVDINENELYFLSRTLQEKFPDVKTEAIVADIRDAARMQQLGRRYRPQAVFHAAAHKHVPLMEVAPQEAIKNNVFGTLNVARMASDCGADNFILISTDKAVAPTSVMGASKAVAEFVIRALARTSKTRFTAVRFGNVLGSAGSVVPLFKQQIERRGPVTVTHPDCTRYFMTIPEAVGLVLIAGLGGYGELCILDMGEPIRIADLAAHMITMAGFIPGVEIPIVYTGLRPGEKLFEKLFTDAEEQTLVVRNRIRVAKPAPPREGFFEELEQLEISAMSNDADEVVEALRRIVPHFQPDRKREIEPSHPSPRLRRRQLAPAVDLENDA